MNPRQLGCLFIVGGFVALGVKLWFDFGPKLDVSEWASESPKAHEAAGESPQEPNETVTPPAAATPPEDVEPPGVPLARFVVYLNDSGCATREEQSAKTGLQTDIQDTAGLPPPEELELTRGLVKSDLAALRKAGYAVLIYVPARPPSLGTIQTAQKLAGAMAQSCGGFVSDLDLGLTFSPAAWKKEVLDTWLGDGPGALPRVTNHFSTSTVKTPQGTVLHTHGVSRFGVPEIELLVAGKVPPAAGRLIDLAAQHEVERGGLDPDVLLEIDGIDQHEAREQYERMASSDALLNARVKVSEVDEEDPPTVRLELNEEQLRKADLALFGSPGARAKAVKALSAKANAKLVKEVLPRFKQGLQEGEALFVLGPEGWVRVDRWTGTRFSGADAADPISRRLPLEVEPRKAIDYAFLHANGTWEGNSTGIELGAR